MFLIGPSVSLLHFGQVQDPRCENDDIVFGRVYAAKCCTTVPLLPWYIFDVEKIKFNGNDAKNAKIVFQQ